MTDEHKIHQDISGTVTGNVIQASSIGTVINNAPPPTVSLADEIPGSVRHYINYQPQLDAITRAARLDEDGTGLAVVEIHGGPLSGKSEVAYQWAKRHQDHFSGGRFHAELGPDADLYSVLARWLRYRGHALDRLPPTLAELGGFWRSETAGARLLIMLDGAGSEDIELLMPSGGGSTVLVIPMPGATLAKFRARRSTATPVRLTPLTVDQALALLTHRLDEGREDNGRVEQEREAAERLIEICHHSAGVLNIAAGMLVLDADALIDELVERLERDGVTTHLGLTVIFDAAYDVLDENVRRVYRAFGAHPGAQLPITKDAVAAALDLTPRQADDALDILSQASLIRRAGRRAYSLNSQVAEHAADKAGAELPALRAAFIAYYRDYGMRCAETLKPGRGWTDQVTPLASYEEAQRWLVDNETAIQAAATWGDHASVIQLCLVTWPIYQRGGYTAKMVKLNQFGVKAAAALTDRDPAHEWQLSLMLTQLAFAYRQQGELESAAKTFRWAATIGNAESRQSALEGLGLALRDQGLIEDARQALDENLRQAERIGGAPRRTAMARWHRSTVLPPEAAVDELTAVRTAFEAEPENLVKIDYWLGATLRRRGDRAEARTVLDRATEGAQRHNMQRELGLIQLELADVDPADAEQHLRAALRILQSGFPVEARRVRTRMTELGFAEQS